MAKSQAMQQSDAQSWVNYRRWKKVSSSNVMAIHYDKYTKTLSVQFKGTAKGVRFPIYTYNPVPSTVAESMYLSGSKGKFVHQVLKKGPYTTRGPL